MLGRILLSPQPSEHLTLSGVWGSSRIQDNTPGQLGRGGPAKEKPAIFTSASRKAELMGGDRKQVSRRISPRGCLPHPDLGSNPDPTTSQLRTCAIICLYFLSKMGINTFPHRGNSQ